MRGYISYFKTVLLSGLQYKTAAIAGILTQFFWGFLQIFIYQAFYQGTKGEVSMDFDKLVTYIWLQQALLTLVFVRIRDESIAKSIKNGSVAYEIVRPYNLYVWWYVQCIAKRLAAVILRSGLLIIVALFLPKPYNLSLPASWSSFGMSCLNLFFGALIVTAITVIIHSIAFYIYDDKGIACVIYNLAELLSGTSLPLPLLPNVVQKICLLFPFWLIGDLPFRIYSGDILISESLKYLGLQAFWLVALIIIGAVILKHAMKKVYIQGG